jgi:hypothetical protein
MKAKTVVSKNVANVPVARNVIIAISIKPSPRPEEQADSSFLFRMCFVDLGGKKVYAPCSKSIWSQIDQHRYCNDHVNNFKLRYDPVKKQITSIDRFPKPEQNPQYFQVAGEENSGKVLLLVGHDGEVSVKNAPQDVPSGTVDEIVELAQANPDIDADDLLGDRFLVESSTKRAGQRTLTIDPVAR